MKKRISIGLDNEKYLLLSQLAKVENRTVANYVGRLVRLHIEKLKEEK